MPTYPRTGAATTNSLVFGSCKIEVSTDSGATYTDIGMARNLVVNETPVITEIQADNTPDPVFYVSTHEVEIGFNLIELYLVHMNTIRGGIDTLTQVSTGSTTAIDSHSTGASSADRFIALANQGTGDTGTTISAVKQVSTGNSTTTLTVDDDYVRMLYGDQVGIVMRDDGGSSYNSSESLVIEYGYDKVSYNKLSSGGLTTPSARWYRFTNKQIVSSVAKYRYFYVYSAKITAGLNLAFKSANEDDSVLEIPIALKGELDTTRTEGDQLWAIEDHIAGI